MKKFAALAALAAISGGAYAQSSVTLFGIVDEAARYVKTNQGHQYSLASGGLNTSRLGFRGVEDLGGGLKGGFWLESGFDASSGVNSNTSKFFNRRSTLSLIGNFGEVRLGRDYTPTYTGYVDYDVFGDNGLAASGKFDISLSRSREDQPAPTGGVVGTTAAYTNSGGTRSDNQVAYLLPGNLGGFYGRFSVAPSEATLGKKYYGGRIGYGAGPLDVSVSYGQYKVLAFGGEDKYKIANVGASYDFGVVKIEGYYDENKFATHKISIYSVGAIVPVGVGQVKANWTHANQKGTSITALNTAGVDVNADDANQYAVGYIYNLSKRTAVYGTAAYIKNKGNARFNLAGSPAIDGGQTSKGAEVGVRHSF